MQRKQFTFYRSYYEVLDDMQPEDQLALLRAIIAYALEDKEPELEGIPVIAFKLIRPTLDSGRKKADRIYKKRAMQEGEEESSLESGSCRERHEGSSVQIENGGCQKSSDQDEDRNRRRSSSARNGREDSHEDRGGREYTAAEHESSIQSVNENENENENSSDPDVNRSCHEREKESEAEKELESELELELESELESESESELESESESEKEKDSYILEEKKTESHACARARGADCGFDRFWKAYPRKVGKQAAYRAWSRNEPDEELTEEILSAVEKQKGWEQWSREGGRYIPNPATWLNQGRWEDEPPAQLEKGGRGNGDSGQSGAGAEAADSKWHIRYTNSQV